MYAIKPENHAQDVDFHPFGKVLLNAKVRYRDTPVQDTIKAPATIPLSTCPDGRRAQKPRPLQLSMFVGLGLDWLFNGRGCLMALAQPLLEQNDGIGKIQEAYDETWVSNQLSVMTLTNIEARERVSA
jgi:hypothetical protein